jgi:hypothetical protein
MARGLSTGQPLPDPDAARLLTDLDDVRLRDVAWALVTRESARDHVALWTDLVRRSPADLLPGPAALLAFAAWLCGHGALAWCAVDVCQAADPDHRLAGLVAQLLERAVPPTDWEGWGDGDEWEDRDEWDDGEEWADVLENPA